MTKKEDDPIKLLTKSLDKGNNFIDYFLTIGLGLSVIYSDWLYELSIEEIIESNKFVPEILTKFPPIDKSIINIDENIIHHCFPNGFKPIESIEKPKDQSFSYVLDNSHYDITYLQKFITCIVFYEKFDNYNKVYQKIQKLQYQKNSILEDINESKNSNPFMNKIEDKINLTNINNQQNRLVKYTSEEIKESNTNLKNEFHSNVLPNNKISLNTRNKTSINYMSNSLINNIDDLDSTRLSVSGIRQKFKYYYAPKCICIVSVNPFFNQYSKILNSILSFSQKNIKTIKPLEKIIDNLVLEVPLPPRGLIKVEFPFFNEKFILTQPKMNCLPMVNYRFELIFVLLDTTNIIEIYKHVLLETRIVFFSKKINNLTPIIQGFIQLLFPFKYSFHVITILPENNLYILESVQPCVVGIYNKYSDNYFEGKDLDLEDVNILCVDLDNNKIHLKLNDEIKKLSTDKQKKYIKTTYPDMPDHYKIKLQTRIIEEINLVKQNNNTIGSIYIDKFISNIRNHFFQFIVNIMQKYNEYLNYEYYNSDIGTPSVNNLFHVKEFLKTKKNVDVPFINKLISDTQMFVDFICKRMIPKDNRDKLEIVYFEENLFKKNNRSFNLFNKKRETPFLDNACYDYRTSCKVNPSRSLNDTEKKKLVDDYDLTYKLQFLKLGQDIIVENPNSNNLSNTNIYFKHYFFPILNNDFFFKNNLKEYFLPLSLVDEVETLNTEIVSKSHLNTSKSLQHEMENNIYLTWMLIWAITFWYHEEREKRNRFYQLLKVIEKVKYHEIEIYNLLFEALSLYGEEFMILKLFERLIYYKLNPSYKIKTMVTKQLEKEKFSLNKNTRNIVKYVNDNEYRISSINNYIYKNRSIKFNSNIATENVEFYFNDECLSCGEVINLNKLCREFSLMEKEFEWTTCPNKECNLKILPKLTVSLGIELDIEDDLKINTSLEEKVILFSPYSLKYNCSVGLLKEFLCKLDLEAFRNRFTPLFWNCIWYFSILELPFDFFLPYENNYNIKKANDLSLRNIDFFVYDMLPIEFDNQYIDKENDTISDISNITCKDTNIIGLINNKDEEIINIINKEKEKEIYNNYRRLSSINSNNMQRMSISSTDNFFFFNKNNNNLLKSRNQNFEINAFQNNSLSYCSKDSAKLNYVNNNNNNININKNNTYDLVNSNLNDESLSNNSFSIKDNNNLLNDEPDIIKNIVEDRLVDNEDKIHNGYNVDNIIYEDKEENNNNLNSEPVSCEKEDNIININDKNSSNLYFMYY